MEHINPMDVTTMVSIKKGQNNSISEQSDKTDYRKMNSGQWDQVSKVK